MSVGNVNTYKNQYIWNQKEKLYIIAGAKLERWKAKKNAINLNQLKDSIYLMEVDNLKEKWVDVNGYKISNIGKIIGKNGREIKGSISKWGYKTCSINLGSDYGVVHGFHRVIATVFIPNPENKPEVNHIDGNKLNNRADNLEWVSKKENQRHASHVLNKRVGKYHYDTNLSDEIVIDIYNKCKYTDMKYEEIARIYNVSKDTPAKIAQGYSWKYLNLEPINRKDKRIVGKNLKTGKEIEYDSVRFAVKDGFSAACISGCCKGNLKTHKGYSWSYKNSK